MSAPISPGSSTLSASWISACRSLVMHCRDRPSSKALVPVHACSKLGTCLTGTTGQARNQGGWSGQTTPHLSAKGPLSQVKESVRACNKSKISFHLSLYCNVDLTYFVTCDTVHSD